MQGTLSELGICQDQVRVFYDSQRAIHLTKHQVFHDRSKHIDVKLHFVRDVISDRAVKVDKIGTGETPADMFTKPILTANFKNGLDLVGI